MKLNLLTCLFLFATALVPAAAAESEEAPAASCTTADVGEVLFGTLTCAVKTADSAWDQGIATAEGTWSSAVQTIDNLPESGFKTAGATAEAANGAITQAVPCYRDVVVDMVTACTDGTVRPPAVVVEPLDPAALKDVSDAQQLLTCVLVGCTE